MINDHETQNNDILISDATFWDLYPVDLSSVENVSVQSLPVSVRVTNLLMHNGVRSPFLCAKVLTKIINPPKRVAIGKENTQRKRRLF